MGIQVMEDSKKEIQFWLHAMNNPNVSKENIDLLNKCLKEELERYLTPISPKFYSSKTIEI